MLFYRRQLTKALANVPIPVFVTGILLSVPLIIVEEQIDCMRSWCGQVLIPPTLPFLFVEVIIVGLIALRIHAASAVRVVSVYSVFGVLWEVFLGGLAGAPFLITLLFAPYVWTGYAFISLLPISVLLTRKSGIKASNASTPPSSSNPVEGSATLVAKQFVDPLIW